MFQFSVFFTPKITEQFNVLGLTADEKVAEPLANMNKHLAANANMTNTHM